MFIWRYGVIEDVIFSCNNCNENICKVFYCKNKLNFVDFKNKLKEWFYEGDRKSFYVELVKVDEIDRFLKFIEKKDGVINEENYSNF